MSSNENFDKAYKGIKVVVVDTMLKAKSGEVKVPVSILPGYISQNWLDDSILHLKADLAKEYGVENVFLQDADNAEQKERCIVIVG